MTRMFCRFALVLGVGLATSAAAAPDSFVAGNAAASVGDHDAAAADFEREIATHGWSAGALLDLGNAYASAGQKGRAILAYERAHLLAPRDGAITGNLARVREAAGVTVVPPGRLTATLALLTADEWTWIAVVAALLACTALVAFAWRIRRPAARALAVAGAIVGALAFSAATQVAPSSAAAIVVRADTARIAPFAAAEAAFTAPEGEAVQIEQHRDSFVYVRDGDRSGWLPASAVERILVSGRPAA